MHKHRARGVDRVKKVHHVFLRVCVCRVLFRRLGVRALGLCSDVCVCVDFSGNAYLKQHVKACVPG